MLSAGGAAERAVETAGQAVETAGQAVETAGLAVGPGAVPRAVPRAGLRVRAALARLTRPMRLTLPMLSTPSTRPTRLGFRASQGFRGDGARLALLLPLAFQLGVLPTASLIYVGGSGVAGSGPFLALCTGLVVTTAALGFGAVRGVPIRLLLIGDTMLAVAGNLALSGVSLPSDRAVEVSWLFFAGCVAMWTLARGVPAGLAAAACGIPLRLSMFAAAGPVHAVRSAAALGAGDAAVLLLAVVMTGGVLVVADRDAERLRARIRRGLHDTVLQTLEAIAMTLPSDADAEQAPRRLREVRAVAHAEAMALRRELARATGSRVAPGLFEGLVGLAAQVARDGLRVRLDAADDRSGLTSKRRAALLAATREALRNVLKHSGATEALVRVEDAADGLTLTVRDFGTGFDPTAHRPGFGLSQSVSARMAEVGGTASIGSRPGHGTSVTLWVPVEADGEA